MRGSRLTAAALLLLGTGIASSALLGPLVLDLVRFSISPEMENQLVGGEVVALVVVAPLAIAAGVLWLRGHVIAPVLALGPSLYAVYTYIQFIVGPQYGRYPGNGERAFPLYVSLVLLGWIVAARAWSSLRDMDLQPPTERIRVTLVGTFLALSAVFALAWIGSVAAVIRGAATREYDLDPTLFWLIRLEDLAFVIPSAVIIAIGLWRRAEWATRFAFGFTGLQVLLTASVAGMALTMTLRRDPSASPLLLIVTLAFSAVLGLAYVGLLKGMTREA